MKHFSVLHRALCVIGLLLLLHAQAGAQALGERLERLLDDSSLADSEVGMAVYDLTDDTCVFRYQEKKLFRPASVEKLVTAITALDALGCGHPFTTRLCYAGQMDGTCLDGDLYVVGGFDPEFGEADMDSLVGWVKRAGIRRISGQLCGDLSMKDSLHWGSGWAWDDNPWYFQPYLSPLLYCKDYVEVTVRPVKGKAQPEVLCRPSSSFYAVTNEARTNDPSAGEFEITRDWLRGSNRIIVRGNCMSPRMERLNMQASQDFFMHAFREKLQAAGVEAGDCAFRPCPEDAALLGECSHSLADVLLPMLKKSDNLSAEAVFYHLAASANPRHAGSEDAVEVIEEMIRSLGFDPSRYRIADGCGVSPYNYVSPELLVAFLKHACRRPDIYGMLCEALPVAGRDGTLRHRMRTGEACGNVRAKTGSMTGVSSLAGYATAANGHVFAFVIINQNVLKPFVARRFQDRVCREICK